MALDGMLISTEEYSIEKFIPNTKLTRSHFFNQEFRLNALKNLIIFTKIDFSKSSKIN